MKKNKFIVGVSSLGIAALLMTGCAKVPQEQIDAAQLSVNNAKAAGAETYLVEEYTAVVESMNTAMVEIENQNSKFFKNYDDATTMLQSVAAQAEDVIANTEAKKQAIKTEIATEIASIKTVIEQNRALITQAPTGKEGTTALMAITGELDLIETSISETDSLMNAGELFASLEKAKAAKEKATALNTELTTVISKYKSGKVK